MILYTTEHEELRAAVRRLFDRSADRASVRAVIDGPEPYDRALWRRMCDELGLAGLAVMERYGGSGYGVVELAVVLEEIGRVNLPSPYLSTVLAGRGLALTVPDAVTGPLVADIAAGRVVVAVHLDPPDSPPAVAVAGGRASGVCTHVVDGAAADLLLLSTSEGPALVRLDDRGVHRRELDTLDLTRCQARITLDQVPTRRLSGAVDEWAGRMLATAAILVAAEQLGGAQRCLEMACAHAASRCQFGRPIGAFQAVKHLCADMLVELELARAAEEHAVATAAAAAPLCDLQAAVSTARVVCSLAFQKIAADMIQVHGGIGFTWEHDAHLFYRRAYASTQLYGSLAAHREQLATHAGLGVRTDGREETQ